VRSAHFHIFAHLAASPSQYFETFCALTMPADGAEEIPNCRLAADI
jgi:hypothetical protein